MIWLLLMMGCVSHNYTGCMHEAMLPADVDKLVLYLPDKVVYTCSELATQNGLAMEWECTNTSSVLHVWRKAGYFEVYDGSKFLVSVSSCGGQEVAAPACHHPECMGMFCGEGSFLKQVINPLYFLGSDDSVVGLRNAYCMFVPEDARTIASLADYGFKQESSRIGLGTSFWEFDRLSYKVPSSDYYYTQLQMVGGIDRFTNYYLPGVGMEGSFYGSQIANRSLGTPKEVPFREYRLFWSRVEPCLNWNDQLFCFQPFSRDDYWAVYDSRWPWEMMQGSGDVAGYSSGGWMNGYVFHPFLRDIDGSQSQVWLRSAEERGYSYMVRCLNCTLPRLDYYPADIEEGHCYTFNGQTRCSSTRISPIYHSWEGDKSPLMRLGSAALMEDSNARPMDLDYARLLYSMVGTFGIRVRTATGQIDYLKEFLKDYIGNLTGTRLNDVKSPKGALGEAIAPRFPYECEYDYECASLHCDKSLYWRGVTLRTTDVMIKEGLSWNRGQYALPVNLDCRPMGTNYVCRYIPISLMLKNETYAEATYERTLPSQGDLLVGSKWPQIFFYHNRKQGADDWRQTGISTSDEFPLIRLDKDDFNNMAEVPSDFQYDYYWLFPTGFTIHEINGHDHLGTWDDLPILKLCGVDNYRILLMARMGEKLSVPDFDVDSWNDPNWDRLVTDDIILAKYNSDAQSGRTGAAGQHFYFTNYQHGTHQFVSITDGYEADWESSWTYGVWVVVGSDDIDMLGHCNMSTTHAYGICSPRPLASVARQDVRLEPTTFTYEYNHTKYLYAKPGPCHRAIEDPLPLYNDEDAVSLTYHINESYHYEYPSVHPSHAGYGDELQLSLLRPFVPLVREACYDKAIYFSTSPPASYIKKKAINYLKANIYPITVITTMDNVVGSAGEELSPITEEEGFNFTVDSYISYLDEGPVIIAFKPGFYVSDHINGNRSLSYALRRAQKHKQEGARILSAVVLDVASDGDLDRAKRFIRERLATPEYPADMVIWDFNFVNYSNYGRLRGTTTAENFTRRMFSIVMNASAYTLRYASIPSVVYVSLPYAHQVGPDIIKRVVLEDRFSTFMFPDEIAHGRTAPDINVMIPAQYKDEGGHLGMLNHRPRLVNGYAYLNISICMEEADPTTMFLHIVYQREDGGRAVQAYSISHDGTYGLDEGANGFNACNRTPNKFYKEWHDVKVRPAGRKLDGLSTDAGGLLPLYLNTSEIKSMSMRVSSDSDFWNYFSLKAYAPTFIYYGGFYNTGLDDVVGPYIYRVYRAYLLTGKQERDGVYAIKHIKIRRILPPRFDRDRLSDKRYGPVSMAIKYNGELNYTWPRRSLFAPPSGGYFFSYWADGSDYTGDLCGGEDLSYPVFWDHDCPGGHFFRGFRNDDGYWGGKLAQFAGLCVHNNPCPGVIRRDEEAFRFENAVDTAWPNGDMEPSSMVYFGMSTISPGTYGFKNQNGFPPEVIEWNTGDLVPMTAMFAGYAVEVEVTFGKFEDLPFGKRHLLNNISAFYSTNKDLLMDTGTIFLGVSNPQPFMNSGLSSMVGQMMLERGLTVNMVELDDTTGLPKCERIGGVRCEGNYTTGTPFVWEFDPLTNDNISGIAGLTYSGQVCYVEGSAMNYTFNFTPHIVSGPLGISYPMNTTTSCHRRGIGGCEADVISSISIANITSSIKNIYCEIMPPSWRSGARH